MIEHPTSEDLAAYLNGALNEPERSALETHLSQCQPCRQEMTGARNVLHRQGIRRLVWVPLVVAAAAGMVLLYAPAPPSNGPIEQIRGAAPPDAEGEVQLRMSVLAPRDGDQIAPTGPVFLWRSEGAATQYRVTLRDGGGRPLWNTETTDTSIVLDSSLDLLPGATYFWYVDALRPDGQSLTSGTMRFSTAP